MVRKTRVYRRSSDKNYSFYFYEEDGRRVFRKTEETARSRAQDYANQYVEDYFREKSEVKITLEEFAKDFFFWGTCGWIKRQHLRGRAFSEYTAHTRRAHLENHILPGFGRRLLGSLNTLEVENWLASLPVSNQTKNHILYTFRIVLRDAESAGYVTSNVLEKVERFSDDAAKRDVFAIAELKQLFPEDFSKLLEIWKTTKHAACYVVLATTGIRTGEARALCWRDNIASGALLIERAVKANGAIGPTKTEDVRIVLLPERAQQLLNDWRDSGENPFTGPEDLIFFGADRDKPYSKDYLGKYFHPALLRAKMTTQGRNLVCHSLRHTYNTIMRQALPLEMLQSLTGHKSLAMTDHYDHPSIEDRLKKLQASRKIVDSVWE